MKRLNREASWIGLLLLLVLLTNQPVEAHTEGKMQLSAESAGPFKMTVFTSPDPAEVGEIHVSALIFTAEDASPVLNADVTVAFAPLGGNGPTLTEQALQGDAENNLLFEAILDVAELGNYLATVTIEDPAGQQGAASFELDVTSSGGFNWLILILALFLGSAVLLWFVFRRKQAQTSVDGELTDPV